MAQGAERRKEYRLPYYHKVIYTDGAQSRTAYAGNLSRGGVFVLTLEPLPLNTEVHLAFTLPSQQGSLCVKSKVAHVVYDRVHCEVDCGMGFMFVDMNESQKSVLNVHILNEKVSYQELQKLLAPEKPMIGEVERYLKKVPHLRGLDLLGLRYKVNRICTLFEPDQKITSETDSDQSAA